MNIIAKGKEQRAWRLSLSDKRIDCFNLHGLCPMPLPLCTWAEGRAHGAWRLSLPIKRIDCFIYACVLCPMPFALCTLRSALCPYRFALRIY